MSKYYKTILQFKKNVQSVSLDPDALLYLEAIRPHYSATWFDDIALTEEQWDRVASDLFVEQKDFGIYNKNKAFYPLAGGTPESIRYNAKDPRNLDAAFRLTAVGSPTVTANGVQGNGTSQYYNTHLISGDYTNDFGYGVYSNSFTTGTFCHGATGVAGGARTELFPRLSSGGVNTFTAIGTGSYTTIAASASGLSSAYRNVNTHYARVNKTEATRTDSSANYTSSKLFLMARNNTAASTVDFYSPDLLQFAYACDFLTKLEHDNFVDIINNFQIALSR